MPPGTVPTVTRRESATAMPARDCRQTRRNARRSCGRRAYACVFSCGACGHTRRVGTRARSIRRRRRRIMRSKPYELFERTCRLPVRYRVAGLLNGERTAWFQTLARRRPHAELAHLHRFPRIGQRHPSCPPNGSRSSDPERTQVVS